MNNRALKLEFKFEVWTRDGVLGFFARSHNGREVHGATANEAVIRYLEWWLEDLAPANLPWRVKANIAIRAVNANTEHR